MQYIIESVPVFSLRISSNLSLSFFILEHHLKRTWLSVLYFLCIIISYNTGCINIINLKLYLSVNAPYIVLFK